MSTTSHESNASDEQVSGPLLRAARPLSGQVRVPGDKSIGHRSLLIGGLCDGDVQVTGLSDGEDNRSTQRVMGQLGVRVARDGTSAIVHGVGKDGLHAPDGDAPLDCGNSGTTMRLVLGVLAGQIFEATLIGDHSLSRRPMRRVLDPLRQMGLEVVAARDNNFAPLTVRGKRPLTAIHYASPIASAQVKSAILLAGLWAEGTTTVTEPEVSRDHTERMLAYFEDGTGRLAARPIHVPGDLSSAAFLLGAALLVPGSEVVVQDVGVNPTRTGFLDVLEAMGVSVHRGDPMVRNHEPSADLGVRFGSLRATTIGGELAVRAIDELPLIATLASRAEGKTLIRDAAELRVKESDRIAQTATMLRSFGVPVDEHEDGMTIHGDPERALTAGRIDADGDHRIAMCASLLALVAPAGTQIGGAATIATSFPSFHRALTALGAE
ncbi:MAG: 3-phosphoshikimate 1-carboxyvinyltransferase, partial [Deltaproteobacteria bacterium]|nr:3-phosphoshikimate 1-carboxyvinyltransferase [Deltaproteobacteria bacterium]